MAQTIPSAGGQMQQIPSVPALPSSVPQLVAPPSMTPAQATQQLPAFVAQRLNVTGVHAYRESELVAVAGFEPGRPVTLQTLYDMADRITQRYRQDGFLVARAYLPAQEIKDGVVTIAVLEGQYGQVRVDNSSSLASDVPRGLLAGLNPGDVIVTEPLEERLLLLSDLPGVQVRSTLAPGASVGLSDLIVEVKPGPRLSGSVDVDNAGNRYTGTNRIGATLNLNNPAGRGDLATLRALTSGSGLQYLRGAYQIPVGRGRVGLAYSDLEYELGREFKALDASGHARIASLFGSYPLIRSRHTNLNLGLTLEGKEFSDRIDAIPAVTDKRAQVAIATLYGDQRDQVGAGGLSSYSLALSSGNLDIRTPAARTLDAATAGSDGHYNKLAFALSRLQQTSPSWSFLASLSGQVAAQNLDVSEKMELGGMYGVRAYPEGEAYADEGYLLTLEARKQLSLPPTMLGQVHLAAFIDAGAVTLNQSPWTAGSNRRHLSGAGVGAYWTRPNDFAVKAFYARKLGSEDALSAPDKSGRFWIQAVKYF
jgi:hemolysin activation/secretion protein